jgi:hypothetical protein
LYEVISSYPHKLYFGIDKSDFPPEEFDANVYLEKVIKIIQQYFPRADLAISGSITPTKISYHLIANNYLIQSERDRENVKNICKYLKANVDDGFDWKVYTKNRNMKCVNQSKPNDESIQEMITHNDNVTNQFITCFFSLNESLPIKELPLEVVEVIEIEQAKKSFFDLALLPKVKLTCPNDLDYDNLKPIDILNMLNLNKDYDHSYTHLVARFCYHHNIDFVDFLTWLQKNTIQ